MIYNRYFCPPNYQCSCLRGTLVSLTTLRRHRATAQQRFKIESGNPFVRLHLPPPVLLRNAANPNHPNPQITRTDKNDHNASGIPRTQGKSTTETSKASTHINSRSAFGSIESMSDESSRVSLSQYSGDASVIDDFESDDGYAAVDMDENYDYYFSRDTNNTSGRDYDILNDSNSYSCNEGAWIEGSESIEESYGALQEIRSVIDDRR